MALLFEPEDSSRLRMQSRRREWIILGPMLGLALLLNLNFGVVRVEGQSMAPTLQPGEYVLLWKTASLYRSYHSGDVVVLRSPEDMILVKRVCFVQNRQGTARMPDRFRTPLGTIMIGDLLNPTGRIAFPGYREQIQKAEQGQEIHRTLYVLGDNVWNSEDSRDFGPVAPDQVLGRVLPTIYWPLRFSQRVGPSHIRLDYD